MGAAQQWDDTGKRRPEYLEKGVFLTVPFDDADNC
jgi:hypothetical protein